MNKEKEIILSEEDYIVEITTYPFREQRKIQTVHFSDFNQGISFVNNYFNEHQKDKYQIRLYQDVVVRKVMIDYQN